MTVAERTIPGHEAASTVEAAPAGRLLTCADLALLPHSLPSGPVRWELHQGELKPMSPPGEEHGNVEGRVAGVLGVFGDFADHGKVYSGKTGIRLQVDPDTVVGVDAAFITNNQLPVETTPEGYLITIPALIVEVVSKNDRPNEVQQKVEQYLQAGARVVWVVHPRARTVTIHQPGQAPTVLTEADALTAEGIIPDLSFPIQRLFR